VQHDEHFMQAALRRGFDGALRQAQHAPTERLQFTILTNISRFAHGQVVPVVAVAFNQENLMVKGLVKV
jgi:hypothetical protein